MSEKVWVQWNNWDIMRKSSLMWPWHVRMVIRWRHTRLSWQPPVHSLMRCFRESNILGHWPTSEGSIRKTCWPSWTFSILLKQKFTKKIWHMDAFLEIAEELKLKWLADQTFTRSSSDVSEDEDKSTNLKPVRNAKKSWNQQPIIFTMLLYLWKSIKWDTEAHSSFTLPKCVERREGPRTYKATLRPTMWKESQFRVIFVGRILAEEPVAGSTKQNFINNHTAYFFWG